jgi:hypothetical protein
MRNVDEEVIRNVAGTEMDRNNLRKVNITETYIFVNDDWWVPN